MSPILRMLSVLASLLVLGTAAAQAEGPYEVTLQPVADLAVGGAPIALQLRIEVREDCKLPATLLSGRDLEVSVNGGKAKPIVTKVSGNVALAGGTVIERTIKIESSEVGAGESSEAIDLVFTWSGVASKAAVKQTPDVSQIAIEDLDLAQTRVALVTDHGTMTVRFYPDKAPNHVKNFIKLSKEGFYNGTKFHRIMRGFMIQGGCPNTKEGATGAPGTGNPGYTVDAEFNDVKHTRGILSMARSQDPNSAGCQFFVMHGDAPGLDGQYSAFGFLEKGADTLDRIASLPVGPSPRGEMSVPREPVHLRFAAVLPVMKK